jgi:hypothetical protein
LVGIGVSGQKGEVFAQCGMIYVLLRRALELQL